MIIVFNAVHETEFNQYLFESFLCHRLRDDELRIVLYSESKIPVFLCLRVIGIVIYYCLLLDLSSLNLIVTRNEVDELASEFFCKLS